MATTKRQNKAMNVAMVVLAVVIVVAGIAAFMLIRGGQSQPSTYTVSEKIGYANIERSGINYTLDVGTALQDGDAVETLDGSEIGVKGSGSTTLFLGDASKMKMHAADSSKSTIELASGCIFADAQSSDSPCELEASGLAWSAKDAVFVSDVRTGSVTVKVLSGDVTFADGTTVKAGEVATHLLNQEQNSAQSASSTASAAGENAAKSADTTSKLTLGSLDAFALDHALDAIKAGRNLTFTEDQIKEEQAKREEERRQVAAQASGASKDSNASENANSDQAQNASGESADAAQGEDANQDQNGENTEEQDGQQDSGTDETQNGEAEQGGGTDGTDEGTQTEEAMTCVIQIRCDTILNNKENLAEGKSKYVPRDGIILGSTTMEFTEGESAFDVLQRACSENGIALEYSYAPVYGSYYVEGIGNLYEFDCGDESGWMYKVNGWFPNYGCSELKLSDGDVVEFCYTCNGLGEDVGA